MLDESEVSFGMGSYATGLSKLAQTLPQSVFNLRKRAHPNIVSLSEVLYAPRRRMECMVWGYTI